ncbi:hypothetical protein TRFO_19591 [Tritrichomonas foetus]|uniref:Protein kinase domain-containing protein n=1 Tax=Tritrichomonas foetus TaxID=1144522 RepID=A0A1J4KI79_9EUKA|nr:hypothetical protein TRFO_19591 [Tritrichomonas foetus]|eukprot:OHT10915.1 hypothetical protein TRFO_19591 [Tritrichomonas foetus]
MIRECLNGLNELWKLGFVHSDIKPDNITVERQTKFHIIDYGNVSKPQKKNPAIVGAVVYRSPEQVLGIEHTYKSDIWSLGVTAAMLYLGYGIYDGLLFDADEEEQLFHQFINRFGPIDKTFFEMIPEATTKQYFTKGDFKKMIPMDVFYRKNYENGQQKANISYLKMSFFELFHNWRTIFYENDPERCKEEIKQSELLYDLLVKMMKINPNERIGYNEILNHEFMKI